MFTKNEMLSTELSTVIPQKRSLFAILVHFGPHEATNRAIASLASGTVVPNQIIVVDHADTPYHAPGSSIAIVRPRENSGYAEGIIEGLGAAQELGIQAQDICFVLNNDAKVSRHSVQKILAWWEEHGSPNMLAGAIYGKISRWSGRASLALKKPRVRYGDILYMHGSCLIVEYQALASLPIATKMFLYWEDAVISMAVVQRGGRIATIPELDIYHDDRKTPLSPEKLYYLVRNGAYVLARHPVGVWRAYWRILNGLRLIYHSFLPGDRHAMAREALRDAHKGKLGKMPV